MTKIMRTRPFAGMLAVVAALASTMASADFQEALRQYTAGSYGTAHEQFLALAELGDGASQFNLGAMALQGQGGPKDQATGVGWLLAAADNGYSKLSADSLAAMQRKLTEEQRRVAQSIVDHYGHAALLASVLPQSNFRITCPDVTPGKPLEDGPSLYPQNAQREGRDGIVITELTVGVDGLARDPEILMAAPREDFPVAAIDGLLQGRYQPAMKNGIPVESRITAKTVFMINGQGVLWSTGALQKVRAAAAVGEPSSQYLIGLAATLDTSLGIPIPDAHKLLVGAAQGGNPAAQYWVGRSFEPLAACNEDAKKLPWLRQSAASGDGSAQVALAMTLLAASPTPEQVVQARSLLERAVDFDDFYVSKHVGALMAASPIEALRNPATALVLTKRLMWGSIQSDPEMFEVAAAAYAVNNDFRSAVGAEDTAIKKATKLYWNTSLMTERLATYRTSKPWFGDLFVLPPAATPPPSLHFSKKFCHNGDGSCRQRNPDQPLVPVGSRLAQ